MVHGLSIQMEHELVTVFDAPTGFPLVNIRSFIGSFEWVLDLSEHLWLR